MLLHLISGVSAYRGELAALAGALLWAIASTIYAKAGRTAVPLVLNLLKGIVSITFMVITLLLLRSPLPVMNTNQWLLLVGGGILGIGIGDTAFFAALNHLGARRTVLVEALAPPLATLLAIAFLGEVLGWAAYGGIGITVIGVTWVVLEQTPEVKAKTPATSRNLDSTSPVPAIRDTYRYRRGLMFALIVASCQATGAVMARAALVNTDIDPLWSGLVRLASGTAIVAIILAFQATHPKTDRQIFAPLRSLSFLGLIAITSFGSTFLAIWFQQMAFKYTVAGVAQALLSTSPLFVIPFAVMMGDRVSFRSVLGVVIAIGGIWLLFHRP
ncbi:MAG: DMT family transporter [Leptolyngbyaceae cyanobacterium]